MRDLDAHGLDVGEACSRVAAAMDGAGILWTDSGVGWDREWMALLFKEAGLRPPYQDVQHVDDLLTRLKVQFDEDRYLRAFNWLECQNVRHRALPDARMKAEFAWRCIWDKGLTDEQLFDMLAGLDQS